MMKKYFLAVVIFILPLFENAQVFDDIGNLVNGSKEDANYLVKGYLSPLLETIPYGLNQGWYHTGRPHKLGGFSLTASASLVYIPNSALSYSVSNNELTSIYRAGADGITVSNDPAPTIFGSKDAPNYNFKVSPTPEETRFGTVGGIDVKDALPIQAVPIPMVTVGIGLPAGFEVKGRFFKLNQQGAKVSLWGAGLMYNLKKAIPFKKALPFDLSVFAGYTKLKATAGIDTDLATGEFATTSKGFTVQGLLSKKLSVLTLYTGVGYGFGSSSVNMKGTFNIKGTGETIEDPVDFKISSSSPRVSAGARLKLAVLFFNVDYTIQKYNTLTVGFGLDFGIAEKLRGD